MKSFQEPHYPTYITDLTTFLKQSTQSIDHLLEQSLFTWDEFVTPYALILESIHEFTFRLHHISAVKSTDKIQELEAQSLRIESEWYDTLAQREDLYKAFESLLSQDLLPYQNRFITHILQQFRLKGIGLDVTTKNRLKSINAELSDLSHTFTQNVIRDTAAFSITVSEEDVQDFPEDERARHKDKDGYRFTLQAPSYMAYMRYGNNRSVREKLYKAYSTRAIDNEPIIEKILTLRQEKARLLGFKTYADLSLVFKMADKPQDVFDFLDKVKKDFLPLRDQENEYLQLFAESHSGILDLQQWDRAYFVEQYKKGSLQFDENEIRPYFERQAVQKGLFDILLHLFGLRFEENTNVETWEEDVQCFDVWKDNQLKARVYMDLTARENKREGAWMSHMTTGYAYSDHQKDLPIAFITANFTPSTHTLPSLLTHTEVVTLFHEMGHVLQHICSEQSDITVSGIEGVEWDTVEWSSQFLEGFCFEPSLLKNFARHYKTHEPIPQELLSKLEKQRVFWEGNATIRQLEFALFDMRIHTQVIASAQDVQTVLDTVRSELNISYPSWNKFQCSFQHIFSGGYSAGYYSYKWAEVLSIDAYSEFQSRGFTRENGTHYYDAFLSQGSSKSSADLFRAYMHRDPNPQSLLESVQKAGRTF